MFPWTSGDANQVNFTNALSPNMSELLGLSAADEFDFTRVIPNSKKRSASMLTPEAEPASPELSWAIYASQNFPMFAPYSPSTEFIPAPPAACFASISPAFSHSATSPSPSKSTTSDLSVPQELYAAAPRSPDVSIRACALCALTGCFKCLEGARKVPPQPCHAPEMGRSVCASCAANHRTLTLPRNRALYVPHHLHADLESAAHPQPTGPELLLSAQPFTNFYSHLHGASRCFEIFDAMDTQLWQEPLTFSRVYLFTSAEAADYAKRSFPEYLFALPDEIGLSEDGSPIDNTGLLFRVCSQCSVYQLQHPTLRVPVADASQPKGPGPARRSSALPNFYSASLCRKSNLSHVKKYAQSGLRSKKDPSKAAAARAQFEQKKAFAAQQAAASTARIPATVPSQINADLVPINAMVSAIPIVPYYSSVAGTAGNWVELHATLPVPDMDLSRTPSPSSDIQWVNSKSTRSAFRSRMAFQLLSQHRFAACREYLDEFPINSETELALFARVQILRLASQFFELMDFAHRISPLNELTDAYERKQRLASTTDPSLDGYAAISWLLSSENAIEASKRRLHRDATVVKAIGGLRENIYCMISESLSPRSPFALQNPAVVISSRLLRFVFDTITTNGAFLGGFPVHLLRAPEGISGTRLSLEDIVRSAAVFLDELTVLRKLERNGSDLHRLIVHTEIPVLCILGSAVSRASEARMYRSHQQRSLQNFLEQFGSDALKENALPQPDSLLCTRTARQMLQLWDFTPVSSTAPEPCCNELFQRSITIALNHTGRMFDFSAIGDGELALHITNLPRDTVLAAAMPAFISRAFNELSSGLVAESADPRYAFCMEQLVYNQSVYGVDVDADEDPNAFATTQLSPQDILSLMSWNVCFDHAYETRPAFMLMPIFTCLTSSFFVRPEFEDGDAEALARRSAAVEAAWSQHSTTTLQTWSNMQQIEQLAPRGVRAPRRSMRSVRGIQLMQLALGLAQKLEDSCVTAACVLHLSMMLIYWCPHYDLAMRMLQRLDTECADLIKHLPLAVGPTFERNFIVSCRAQAQSVMRQYKQHSRAGLRSPFFVGTTILLPFDEGVIPGILVPGSISFMMCLLCDHPKYGTIFSFILSPKDIEMCCKDVTRSWMNLFAKVKHDAPGLQHFFGVYPLWSLLHEMRMGRYSLQQFAADLHTREQISVEL